MYANSSFTKIQREILEFTKSFNAVGEKTDCIDYLCRKFNIDRDYYSLWLGNASDFAELVVLYLNSELKDSIRVELAHIIEAVC